MLRGDKINSGAALRGFLRILDVFLSQLIDWAEQTDPPNRELRKWAGEALAERLLFLSAQSDQWYDTNEGFKKRRAEFPDRRHARSPRSYVSWLAGDYLRKLMEERRIADLVLSPLQALHGSSVAQLACFPDERVSWLKRLLALRDFASNPASWTDVVYERMQQDEQYILNLPQMRECSSRDSRQRRRSGEVRLYDFKPTITDAVMRLASKKSGSFRGIMRPA